MIERLQSKLARDRRKRHLRGVPWQSQTTFEERGTHFFEPQLAGPSTFLETCISPSTITGVANLLRKLTPDAYVEMNLEFYEAGLARFGSAWRYADILTVLHGVASSIVVTSYLEIGVRRGRSMSMVAASHPDASIVGFDMWIENYVGIENPGPDFVRKEIERVGHNGDVTFVSGNSRETVPKYFRDHPDAYFDMITVDGDHSATGAAADLRNVIPRLKVGGILVFDDLCNQYHPRLRAVWDRYIAGSSRFAVGEFDEAGYGVGFAIKRY